MSIMYCDKHGTWDSDNMSECPRCDYVDESSPPTVQQTTCEFCEPDGYANHAPRCPVFLEGELASLKRHFSQLNQRLTDANAQITDLVRTEKNLKDIIEFAVNVLTISRGAGARDYLIKKWIDRALDAIT